MMLPEGLPPLAPLERRPESRVYAKRAGRHRWRYFDGRNRYIGQLRWSAGSKLGAWKAPGLDPVGIFAGSAKAAMELGFDYARQELGL